MIRLGSIIYIRWRLSLLCKVLVSDISYISICISIDLRIIEVARRFINSQLEKSRREQEKLVDLSVLPFAIAITKNPLYHSSPHYCGIQPLQGGGNGTAFDVKLHEP